MWFREHGSWIWVAVLWTLVQLPFLSGPFRIDDPYHLEAAQQMRRAPADPYGFEINWDGTPKSAFDTYASPPLVPAWLAFWAYLCPQNEVSLHAAMLPFSLAAILTFGLLAKSFDIRPWVAMGLLACSPAFFLGSQVLMPDLPMLCLFLLTVTGARFYQLRQNSWAAPVACIAGFCCPLAKYNGVVLVPVLIFLELARWRTLRPDPKTGGDGSSSRRSTLFTPGMVTIISAPILSLICWGAFTWTKYGAVHFLKMSAFQRGQAHSLDAATLTAAVLGVLGVGVVPLVLVGFLFRPQRRASWVVGVTSCSIAGAALLAKLVNYKLSSILLFALSVCISVYILATAICFAWRRFSSKDSILISLVVWILLGLSFQYGLMFSAVRYVLFLAPPVILLVLRLSAWNPGHNRVVLMFVGNLLFVVALGLADARQAWVYPSVVAEEIRPRLEKSGGRFFFDGHWGFQYYASQIGGTPIDELNLPALRAGDLIVVAKTAWSKLKQPPPAPGFDVETTLLMVPASGVLRTVSCGAGANFYASVVSDCERPTWLPFGFSSEPAETFVFYQVKKPSMAERLTSQESGR